MNHKELEGILCSVKEELVNWGCGFGWGNSFPEELDDILKPLTRIISEGFNDDK